MSEFALVMLVLVGGLAFGFFFGFMAGKERGYDLAWKYMRMAREARDD